MRQLTISISLLALLLWSASPALAGREGVPGRRVGGGTRWTTPRVKSSPNLQGKLSAMSFASRAKLPMSLKLKVMCA
jgi:hypothetical protein